MAEAEEGTFSTLLQHHPPQIYIWNRPHKNTQQSEQKKQPRPHQATREKRGTSRPSGKKRNGRSVERVYAVTQNTSERSP